MSGNQKTLQVFGIIEIVLGFFNAFNAIWGTGRWSAVGLNAITAVALINAAKDPSKIMPAWVIMTHGVDKWQTRASVRTEPGLQTDCFPFQIIKYVKL